MNRPLTALAALAITSGCAVVQDPFSEEIDASGLVIVTGDLDGDFAYVGAAGMDVIEVEGLSSGTGRTAELADEREDSNSWDISVQGDTLALSSDSNGLAEVDFDLFGPDQMSFDIHSEGDVVLDDVSGQIWIDADEIDAEGIIGGAELYADNDIDLAIAPGNSDRVYIESRSGDVNLTLAYGMGYDIQIWADAEQYISVEDFGFHSLADGPGYFAAVAGNGAIRVDIVAQDGSVNIRQAW